MNVAAFVSSINSAGGLSRPSRYLVNIYPGTLASNMAGVTNSGVDWLRDYAGMDSSATGQRLQMFCTASELPGFQFQTDTQRIYGPAYKFAHAPEYQDITLSFYVGADMGEKYFFDAWMYLVCDPLTNDFNYSSEYTTDIDILQCDVDDAATYLTTLVDAHPISLGRLQQGWDQKDQVHKLDVTFAYKTAVPFNGKGSTAGMGVRGQQVTFRQTVALRTPSTTPSGG